MRPATDPTQHPTETELRERRGGYIPTLDGWRALAILWVLENHSRRWSWHGLSNVPIANTGDRGVALFFALSGFLICTRLLEEEAQHGRISLKSFYIRRFFRIQPAAWAFLAVLSLITLLGWVPAFWRGILSATLMIRNLWPHARYTPGFWYTGHFWSLAAEEHFYLLFPGFFVLTRRIRLPALMAFTLLMLLWRAYVLQHWNLWKFGNMISFRTDLVLPGILLGCLAAVALRRPAVLAFAQRHLSPSVALLYAAAIFTAVALRNSRVNEPLLMTVYPLLIVSTALHPLSRFGRFLELAPLRFLGRLSFSLYLWQELFLYPPGTDWFHRHGVLCLCGAFLCALASFFLIEAPMNRLGHRLARRFA